MERPSTDTGAFPSEIAQWIAAARGGDRTALGQLFKACEGWLLKVARENLPPRFQAKSRPSDLVQLTFLEGQQDFAQFQGSTEAELLPWLLQILLHNIANLMREFRTAKRQIARERPLQALSSGDGRQQQVKADTRSPLSELIAREEAAAIEQAVEHLPGKYREVFLLRHRGGLSFQAISDQMGLSLVNVQKMWQRTLRMLQQELVSIHES